MPYYKRFQHLNNTLVSFRHWYEDRGDYEIIIVEDLKNQLDSMEHMNLLSLLDEYEDLCPINHVEYSVETYNPAGMFNLAASQARGPVLILTNPECFHSVNVLSGLDGYPLDEYVVCSCKSVYHQPTIESFEDMTYDFEMWYVHSKHYPRKIHFCTRISKELYNKVGGFDEEYLNGISYDDDDFVRQVDAAGIPITHADELVVLHQVHDRGYGIMQRRRQLEAINEQYYKGKWGL